MSFPFIFNKIVSCHPGAFGIQIVPPAIRQRHPSFFHLSVVSKVTVFPFYLHPPSGNHHTVFLEVIFIVSNLPPAGYFLSIRGDVIFLSFICLPSLSCEHFFPASGLLIRQAVRSLYIHPSGQKAQKQQKRKYTSLHYNSPFIYDEAIQQKYIAAVWPHNPNAFLLYFQMSHKTAPQKTALRLLHTSVKHRRKRSFGNWRYPDGVLLY